MFEWIIFGVVGLLGAIAISLVGAFILMIALEIFSIIVEETFNLLFDTTSLIVWCVKRLLNPREAAE